MDTDAAWNAVAGFLTSLAMEKGLAENSRIAYRQDLGDLIHFCDRLHLTSWNGIKPLHITQYLMELYELGIAPATVNRRLSAFRGFFAYLKREQVIDRDPAHLVTGPRPRRRLPNVLTINEVERLLRQPDPDTNIGIRDRAMLEVIYGCGLRVSELVNLMLDSIRLDLELLRITGKGDKQRLVPIGGYAVNALLKYINDVRPAMIRDRRKSADAVFLSAKLGRPLTRQGFWKLLRQHAVAAGIESRVTPHTLRHSFATHLLEGGAGLRDIQELLGHSSIETTMIYTEIDKSHLMEVLRSCHPRN